MLSRAVIMAIRIYRFLWHPLLDGFAASGMILNRCRLEPTCSAHAIAVLRDEPLVTALNLIWNRLKACEAATRMRREDADMTGGDQSDRGRTDGLTGEPV